MNKLMTVVAASVCAVSLSGTAVAAEDASKIEKTAAETADSSDSEETKEGLVQQMHDIFEAGFDFEFFSSYVWRNAVQTDEPVLQPGVWADLTYFEPFWLGFYVWQNYDLTSRRHECLKGGLTETDYGVHLGVTAWESEDEAMSLDVEIGHEWFVNQQVKSAYREDYKNTAELYAKVTFNNEIVNVYGQASWMYDDFGAYKQGMHYELGFNKEFDVLAPFELPEETLMLGLDWNLNFGDSRYLYFLYGGTSSGAYYHEDEDDTYDDYASNPDSGIGGTTIKAYLTWNITEWMSLVGTIAYTGVLNGSARDALAEQGPDMGWQGSCYRRDLLWGGVSLKFAF